LPFVNVGGIRLFYRLEGIAGRPLLVLSHSIGIDHAMWDLQVSDLLPYFQVLRYDTRGHGASDAPKTEYSLAQLGADVIGLADALGVSKFAFCGLSLGGAIGQWLAANAPDRITALILANTSPQFGPPVNWNTRIAAVQKGGMAAITDLAMQRFFSPDTIQSSPEAASVRAILLATDPDGYIGCCAALRDADQVQSLRNIKAPTLIIVGDQDISTPWTGHGEILAREIPASRAVHLPAAHISNIERPRSFTAALLEFLHPQASYEDPLQAGHKTRRATLGDAHVDKAIANTTEFNRDFQELLTRYAWGTVWTRPGLNRRTRRLLVLAITAALGRWEEFTLHVRAGLSHELEPCDVKEALLQTAVYAGLPAANTAFKIASEQIKNPEFKNASEVETRTK
jgi:3-oxoadipate enol-lactonase/4-carboxymuconolactone decarboxylase